MTIVGYQTGQENDPNRMNWAGTGPRPLTWSAWYPAQHGTGIEPDMPQFFEMGDLAVNAASAPGPHPAVLLSHGTGGAPESLGWLARDLASKGYVVIGAHHHGNTGSEPYRAEGFLCWWERALDLSELLTAHSTTGPFAAHIDITKAHVIGFSLGAYTALAMAGARTSMDRYLAWTKGTRFENEGPKEFPNAPDHIPKLLENSAPFRGAWARQRNDFTDPRIKNFVAIAPPPPVRGFDEASVQAVENPVTLITGEADREAPSPDCADWLEQMNTRFTRISVGADVGHYTFLGQAGPAVVDDMNWLFQDKPGVARNKVHSLTAQAVLAGLAHPAPQ